MTLASVDTATQFLALVAPLCLSGQVTVQLVGTPTAQELEEVRPLLATAQHLKMTTRQGPHTRALLDIVFADGASVHAGARYVLRVRKYDAALRVSVLVLLMCVLLVCLVLQRR